MTVTDEDRAKAAELRQQLAEAFLAKWRREYEEETVYLPTNVDPEMLSPVSDTSHGELAAEYADAILPVVAAALAAERAAADQLRADVLALADELDARVERLAYRDDDYGTGVRNGLAQAATRLRAVAGAQP